MPGLKPQRSGKGVRSENASRNAYVMRRNFYDLHRKFGSEMATKSSRKIDGENPSLSGISHAACATSLSARRGGVRDLRSRCAPLQAPLPLAAGPLQRGELSRSRAARRAAIPFWGSGLVKASFQRPAPQNEISIAFAMLTP